MIRARIAEHLVYATNSHSIANVAGDPPIFGAIGPFTCDKCAHISAAPMKIRAAAIIRDSQIASIRTEIACSV